MRMIGIGTFVICPPAIAISVCSGLYPGGKRQVESEKNRDIAEKCTQTHYHTQVGYDLSSQSSM